jgi:hypothetical protein
MTKNNKRAKGCRKRRLLNANKWHSARMPRRCQLVKFGGIKRAEDGTVEKWLLAISSPEKAPEPATIRSGPR